MKRILLFANPGRKEAANAMHEMAEWLSGKAEVVKCINSTTEADLSPAETDYIITFGGDGTILHVANLMGEEQIPVLGINLGRLGYLAEVPLDRMHNGVEALLADKAEIAERMMLSCTRSSKEGKDCHHGHALNDVLIASANGRMLEMDVTIDGRPVARMRGDGLVVATPTGSTAHSLSAGGPILTPSLRAMVLTPLCPHELAIRPLVIDANETIEVTVKNSSPARVAVDGRDICHPDSDTRVTIKASSRMFRLVQMPELGRYDILRQKLGWGGRE